MRLLLVEHVVEQAGDIVAFFGTLKASPNLAACAVMALGILMFGSGNANAQEISASPLMEEIIVTARKREEVLTEVPVSISVVNEQLLEEAGIFDSFDLFDATVGFEYDTGWGDRNTAQPGVRGVQGSGIGVNQQKVNSFLDGFPLLGQQGTMQYDDIQRVELYRGPQSATFGRATFGGAINYVSRDPSEFFETEVSFGSSDLGRNEISVALGGPITDTLGFTLDLSSDEYDGPDEWVTTDGYRLGRTATDYASGKLVFTPSENFTAKVRFIHLDSDDSPGIRWHIPLAEQQACSNFALPGMGMAAPTLYYQGDVTAACNLSQQGPLRRNHDFTAGVDPADPNYQLLLANSVLGEPFAVDERDRIHVELDFAVGDGTLQVLGMRSDEFYETWQDNDRTSGTPVPFGINPNIPGAGIGLMNAISMANPFDLSEEYLEVRWVSPDSERLRYLVGASYYDALTDGQSFFQKAGVILGLDGDLIQGRPFGPAAQFGDRAENTGLFGNISYDLSGRTTVTAEARYQSDTISAVDKIAGLQLENETTAFLPRFSVTHVVNDDLTLYGQLSEGNNPAGVNIGYASPNTVAALEIAQAVGEVTYDAFTFREYEEERLTNLEIGIKGSAFDNQLSFAAALYTLDWEKRIGLSFLNWDGDWNDGSLSGGVIYNQQDLFELTNLNTGTTSINGLEFEGTYFINDNWSLNGSLSLMDGQYDEFCDIRSAGGPFYQPADGTDPRSGTPCVILDGNEIPNVSDTTYNLGLTYRTMLGSSGWRLSSRLDLRHASEQWLESINIMKLGDRDIVNGSVTLANDAWTIRFWGNNLTNEDTPRTIFPFLDYDTAPNVQRTFDVAPQRPKEIGVSVAYFFSN